MAAELWIHWIGAEKKWTSAHHPQKARSRNDFSPHMLCGRWLPDDSHWEFVLYPESTHRCVACLRKLRP